MSARSQKLVTRSELSRMAGVKPNTMTALCKKRLFRALVGRKVDVNHPDVQQYLAEQEIKRPKATRPDKHEDPDHVPAEIEKVMDWSLRDILTKYGTKTEFKDVLTAAAKIEDIAAKRLKNSVTKGELISRQLVEAYILDAFEAAHMQLLTDGAKKMASKTMMLVGTGENQSAVERELSTQMSRYLKAAIDKARRELAQLETRIDDE